jgi:hypothetical protein
LFIHPPTRSFVRPKAEKTLQEENATLIRFDNEFKDLERDAGLKLKKYGRDM